MKTIYILIAALLLSFNAFTQKTNLKDVVEFEMPNGGAYIKNRSDTSIYTKYPGIFIMKKFGNGEYFEVKNVLIKLVGSTKNISLEAIKTYKSDFDNGAGIDGNELSVFKHYNNYSVWIRFQSFDKISQYNIDCVSDTQKAGVRGILEFKTGDRSHAAAVLQKLLSRMHFKQ